MCAILCHRGLHINVNNNNNNNNNQVLKIIQNAVKSDVKTGRI